MKKYRYSDEEDSEIEEPEEDPQITQLKQASADLKVPSIHTRSKQSSLNNSIESKNGEEDDPGDIEALRANVKLFEEQKRLEQLKQELDE